MRYILLFCVAAVSLCGCSHTDKTASTLTVRLAVNDIYCKQTACSCIHDVASREYAETQKILREKYSIDLQLDYFEEPYELEKAILAGTHDGVICKPWTAMLVSKKAGRSYTRIADILDPSDNQWLTGIIVVMADSKAKTLKDIIGGSIVMGPPDAYEKHHAARRLFSQKKMTFARTEHKASCIENIGMLMDGKVDAAVVSDYALSAGCAVDFADPEDFRVLATTEKIPLTSVMIDTAEVSPSTQRHLQKSLLAISASGVPESMLSKGFVEPSAWKPMELKEQK